MKRAILINLFISVCAVLLCLPIGELACRLVFEPRDFLKPETIQDPILGTRIKPHSKGHDKLGFRNSEVPDKVNLVTLGDSQTYGTASTYVDSWPQQMAKKANQSIYNLGTPAHGPGHYYYLFEKYALSFKPNQIYLCLYYGNDFNDAFNFVYTKDAYSRLRNPNQTHLAKLVEDEFYTPNAKPFRKTRDYLARNSILYRVMTSQFGNLVRVIEAKADNRGHQRTAFVKSSSGKTLTILDPNIRYHTTNLNDARVTEGIRLSKKIIEEIHARCTENQIDFNVILMPTKITAYAHHQHNIESTPETATQIKKIVQNEAIISQDLESFFEKEGIPYVNLTAFLQTLSDSEKQIYPIHDSHLNNFGNRQIATFIHNSKK